MITIQTKVQFGRRGRATKAGATPASGRIPRVARLMALAIRFDQMIRDGFVNQTELARLGQVTRARLTQIMNLLSLAPDLQEALLFLPQTRRGREVVTERSVRPLAKMHWSEQRDAWKRIASQY